MVDSGLAGVEPALTPEGAERVTVSVDKEEDTELDSVEVT